MSLTEHVTNRIGRTMPIPSDAERVELVLIQFSIPLAIKRQVKLIAATLDSSMQDIMAEALVEGLAKYKTEALERVRNELGGQEQKEGTEPGEQDE